MYYGVNSMVAPAAAGDKAAVFELMNKRWLDMGGPPPSTRSLCPVISLSSSAMLSS